MPDKINLRSTKPEPIKEKHQCPMCGATTHAIVRDFLNDPLTLEEILCNSCYEQTDE